MSIKNKNQKYPKLLAFTYKPKGQGWGTLSRISKILVKVCNEKVTLLKKTDILKAYDLSSRSWCTHILIELFYLTGDKTCRSLSK